MGDQAASPQPFETPIPLAAQDPSTWDDTALLQAYARATKSHKLSNPTLTPPASPRPPPKRRRMQPSPSPIPTTTPATSNKRRRTTSPPPSPPVLLPPPLPPPDATPELEALLLSWYEAGYRAGAFLASEQGH